MLGRYASSLALYTLDVGCRNLSRQQGVFGVVLEVTSTEGIAVQVHAWAEDDVTAVFLGLIADSLTDLADEFRVPCRGQTGADWEGCGVVGLVGTLAGGIDTYTGRTVGKYGGWDAETRDGRRGSRSTCHEVGLTAYHGIGTEEVVCTANE